MEIYADITDEGLQPFYTYTLDEIIEQYEYDGNRMPIDKVYIQYDEDEYYLEDPAEVEADDQLLTEDEVETAIAWREEKNARQKEREEMERREKERALEFVENHPIRSSIMDPAWWAVDGFLGLAFLGFGFLSVFGIYALLALYFG